MWNRRDGDTGRQGDTASPSLPASSSEAAELDLLLIPGDARIERVTDFNGNAVTGARIYSLSYSDGAVFYFWMQV